MQAALDVSRRLLQIERHQLRAEGNSLLELAQSHRVQFVVQLWLAHQQNLQQLGLGRFQVGQQPDLFQNLRRQLMRLIHHQHRGQPLAVALDYVPVELQEQFTFILVRRRQLEISGDVLQKLNRRHQAVKHIGVGDIVIFLEQLQQAAQQQRFASSYFTRQDDESFTPPHAIIKCSQRLVVPLRREQKRRVGSDLKRLACQIEKGFIHFRKLSA